MTTESLPSRERGLKFPCDSLSHDTINVAPLAGAWVEIISLVVNSVHG